MSTGQSCSKAWVTAAFQDSTLHFEVSIDTPIDELCALLISLSRGHGDPLMVEITFPPAPAETGPHEGESHFWSAYDA